MMKFHHISCLKRKKADKKHQWWMHIINLGSWVTRRPLTESVIFHMILPPLHTHGRTLSHTHTYICTLFYSECNLHNVCFCDCANGPGSCPLLSVPKLTVSISLLLYLLSKSHQHSSAEGWNTSSNFSIKIKVTCGIQEGVAVRASLGPTYWQIKPNDLSVRRSC